MIRAAALAALLAAPATAGTLRIATYGPDLSRQGPGLLLRDIQSGKDAQIAAVVQVIAKADADVLLLTGFDWDAEGSALDAFAALLAEAGAPYPHRFAGPPNSGLATGRDLDGDGRSGTPNDAQGFGRFRGEAAMALLSRRPLGAITDHSATLWLDQPDNLAPEGTDPGQRLSSTAHWQIELPIGAATLNLLAWKATPPVFDGPEDRNGRRNADELTFWTRHATAPFVLIGNVNLDPQDGEGRREAWDRIWPLVTDPQPRSEGGAAAPGTGTHNGDPALDTADWPEDGPGNMRVDVVLPSKDLRVTASGVLWPAPGEPLADTVATASRHRLVWVDLDLP